MHTVPPSTEIRFIADDEVLAYHQAISLGFGFDPIEREDLLDRFLAVNPVGTCIAAFDRGTIVATFGSYDLELTVPGGSALPAAGTTHVTVHPTMRRRGLLRAMMQLHLQQAIDRGQPMAALWASEETIYRRFGYGQACGGQEITFGPASVDLPPPDPDLSFHVLTVDQATATLPEVYRQANAALPGYFPRSAEWWRYRHLDEMPELHQGGSRRRIVVVERAEVAVGYVMYRQRGGDDPGEGTTEVVELVAVDDRARLALWHYAANVDLYRNVRYWNAPLDDPVVHAAARFRSINRQPIDTMWLRPLDVPALLAARHFDRDGTITIDVVDTVLDRGGRFRLEVADGRGQAEPTEAEAEVTLDIAALGQLYLGGVSAIDLARAGALEASDSMAVERLHDVFGRRRPPYCIEVF